MIWINKLFCGNTEATPSNIEAHKDEIKVPVSFLSAQNIVYAGEEVGLSRLAFKAKQLGNKYVTIDRNIYYQALNNIAKGRRLDYSIQRSAKLNLLGIRYEKEGNIEDAVKVYEENIAMRSNGRHAYDRLKIIYRRQKDRENEIRVLRVAIGVFGEDSEYNERLLKLLSKTKEPF